MISRKEMEALLVEEYNTSTDDICLYDLLDISIFVVPWGDKKETNVDEPI